MSLVIQPGRLADASFKCMAFPAESHVKAKIKVQKCIWLLCGNVGHSWINGFE